MDHYDIFYSQLNIDEIDNIPYHQTKTEIKALIEQGNLFEMTSEVEELAQEYIKSGIIPQKYDDDAKHLALAVVNGIDILVSWNYKHLVKRKTRIEVNLLNSKDGYRSIDILTPPEL